RALIYRDVAAFDDEMLDAVEHAVGKENREVDSRCLEAFVERFQRLLSIAHSRLAGIGDVRLRRLHFLRLTHDGSLSAKRPILLRQKLKCANPSPVTA